MQSEKFSYRFQIKEQHLDSFGHVNNAEYLALYEEARWELITHNGYGIEEVKKYKQGPVVLEVKVRFRKELKNREFITIESMDANVKGKIMQLTQRMINEKGELCSDAHFTFGFMDLKERKLITPPPMWLNAMGITL